MEYSVDICQVHLIYGTIQLQSFFGLDDLSISDREILKPPTVTATVYLCF
jgi:hypothetical protein